MEMPETFTWEKTMDPEPGREHIPLSMQAPEWEVIPDMI